MKLGTDMGVGRFDVVIGHYMFYMLHHSGQWSPEYKRLCKICSYFRPSPLGIDLEADENFGAREVYNELCYKHGFPDSVMSEEELD